MNHTDGTLQQLVLELGQFGSRKAVGVQGSIGVRWWSYAALQQASFAAARLLEERGLGKGDRVILRARNSPEWVAWLLGAMWQGVVVVPVDDDHSESFTAMVAEAANARLIIHEAHHSVPSFVPDSLLIGDLNAMRPTEPVAPTPASISPGDTAAIVFTSGTVSKPRGIVLTHHNILSQLTRFHGWRRLIRFVPIRMLGIAPLSHVQGLVGDICVPLSLGLTVLYVQSLNVAQLIRTIRIYKITVLVTVPRVVRVLTRAIQELPSDVPGQSIGARARAIRSRAYRRHVMFNQLNRILGTRFWVIIVGGATFSTEDEVFWQSTGRFVVQGYGLTETTGIATVARPFLRPVGSMGRLPSDGSMIVSPSGELLIRGETVASEYIDGEARRPLLEDGYLHTGDLVRTDEHGELYFLGRRADTIVTAEGFNVFAPEVESVLQEQAGVTDALVCARKPEGHEQVHAVLVLRPGVAPEDVVKAANRQLERHQTIKSWSLWPGDELPRGGLQKVKRHEVLEALDGQGVVVSTPRQAASAPAPSVERALALIGDSARVSDQNLALTDDLGLSSLDMVELVARIEQQRGVPLDHLAVRMDSTIGDLRQALDTAQSSSHDRVSSYAVDWRSNFFGRTIQFLVRLLLIDTWFRMAHRVVCVGAENLEQLRPPFVIAAAPHRHWLDVFAISCAAPTWLRPQLLAITNYEFDHHRKLGVVRRWLLAFLRRFLVPAVFPFVIVPPFGRTREGLFETARMMDRGYVPMTFPKGFHFGEVDATRHDSGVTRLAMEFGAAVVPVWIVGNDELHGRSWFGRPKIVISIGRPIRAIPEQSPENFVRLVERGFEQLAEATAQVREHPSAEWQNPPLEALGRPKERSDRS